MARPLLDIDPEQVEQLAAIDCTMKEMAAVLNCSVDTLENRFSDVIAKGKEVGKMSLRRKMWNTAMNGNVTMMIWLSKQRLNYKENLKQETVQTNVAVEATSEEGLVIIKELIELRKEK